MCTQKLGAYIIYVTMKSTLHPGVNVCDKLWIIETTKAVVRATNVAPPHGALLTVANVAHVEKSVYDM